MPRNQQHNRISTRAAGRATWIRNSIGFLLLLLISEFATAQVTRSGYKNLLQTELSGPFMTFATRHNHRFFRCALEYDRILPTQPRLALSVAAEYMRLEEEFVEEWFWRYPGHPPGIGLWMDGRIRQKQVSIPIGLQWSTRDFSLGRTALHAFVEPRLAPCLLWGRKMADHVNGGRDYDVQAYGLNPRLRLGVHWAMAARWSLRLQGELLQVHYLGSGRRVWAVFPGLNLGFGF